MRTKISVADIVNRGLCIGCGICELACPSNAIAISYDAQRGLFIPIVDSNKCTNCGSCLRVCFGIGIDYDLSKRKSLSEFFKSTIGYLHGCYLGFALNHETRTTATSGGIVTALLHYLMDAREIDGAIVAKTLKGRLMQSKSFIAWNEIEIIEALGSKYCPVLSSDAIKKIQPEKKLVFVGLPCQIYAMKKYSETNPLLKKSIIIYIGLFCGGTPNYNGTQYLLRTYSISHEEVERLLYRGGGWPGRMLIQTKQKTYTIPFIEYWPIISPWFHLNRCTICASGLNIQADISCGDAWLPEILKDDNEGTSILCSRTKLGERVLRDAVKGGYIELRKVSRHMFTKSQRSMFSFKHLRLNARLKILNLFMRKHIIRNVIPEGVGSVKPNILFDEFLLLLGRLLASRKKWWPLFKIFRIALRFFRSFTRILSHQAS